MIFFSPFLIRWSWKCVVFFPCKLKFQLAFSKNISVGVFSHRWWSLSGGHASDFTPSRVLFSWKHTLRLVSVCVWVWVCLCFSVTDIESQLWGPSVWLWPSSSPSHLQLGGRGKSACSPSARARHTHESKKSSEFAAVHISRPSSIFGKRTDLVNLAIALNQPTAGSRRTHAQQHTIRVPRSLHSTHSCYSQPEPWASHLAPGPIDL